MDIGWRIGFRHKAAIAIHIGCHQRQGTAEITLQAANVVEEQLGRLAIATGENIAARFGIHHRLMQMHGGAGFIGMGLGHEGGIHVMLQGGLAHGALEHENLIGQFQRVAVVEVDLQLGGAGFMRQRIDIQFLGFAIIVNVFHHGIEIIGRINAIGLAAGFLAA